MARRARLRLPLLRRVARDEEGALIVEFAVVFPVLILAIIGTIETAMIVFISASIESAVLQASRFGVTGGTSEGLTREERVRDIVAAKTYGLVDMDEVEIETLVYDSFADIGKPEPFTDVNGNHAYDLGEPFTDVNGNATWDPDMGAAGLGGAGDVVVYRLSYDWGIMTPYMRRIMGDSVHNVSSVAVRNEPF